MLKTFLKPGWVLLLLFVVAFSYLAFTVLAPWQLGKDDDIVERNELITHAYEADPKPVEDLVDGNGAIQDDEWSRATLHGHYLPQDEVLLRLRRPDGTLLSAGKVVPADVLAKRRETWAEGTVPDGVAIGRLAQDWARGVTAFYDIDTPVTLAKLERGDFEYLSPEVIPGFDLYLSFTGGPTLALNAHGDVVPPGEGWTKPPYGAEIEDGYLYGRAAAVSKSDFATYIFAARALEALGVPLKGALELHFTYDEEVGGLLGPGRLLAQGTAAEASSRSSVRRSGACRLSLRPRPPPLHSRPWVTTPTTVLYSLTMSAKSSCCSRN